MRDFDRLFEKLDSNYNGRGAQDRACQASYYENTLIFVLGLSPAAAGLLLFL